MSQQVTVFGANGKVGRLVVEELLQRHYSVVAFVHNDTDMIESDMLKVIQGDIYSQADVIRALNGSSIIISTLGSWGTPKKDILTVGMKHIIAATRTNPIQTIISLTGADARAAGDSLSILHRLSHLMISAIVDKILYDGEKHIRLLEQSELDYTVIRSPVMSSATPKSKFYTLSSKRPYPWQTINRQLVAYAMVDAIKDRKWHRKSPFLS